MSEAYKAYEEGKKKVASFLTKAQTTYQHLQRENDDLKLNYQRVSGWCKDLSTKQDALVKQKAELTKEYEMFGNAVYNEQNKVFTQVIVFFNIPQILKVSTSWNRLWIGS